MAATSDDIGQKHSELVAIHGGHDAGFDVTERLRKIGQPVTPGRMEIPASLSPS